MALWISFITFLTAGVTATVIQRGQAGRAETDRAQSERHTQVLVAALTAMRGAITNLDLRLDQIEAQITR